MRLFFGLECPPQVAMAVDTWRQRQLPALARPVPMQNFHITLAFIGETPAPELERLLTATDNLTPPPADTLLLDRVGYWPRPGIYWLGPSQWPPALTALATDLNRLPRGDRRGRGQRFCPHITLFRQCRQPPPAPTEAATITLEYDHLTLFESRQGRRGVTYHALEQWSLR